MRLKTQGSLLDRRATLARPLKLILDNQLWQYRSVMIAAAHVEFGLGNINAVKTLLVKIEDYTQGGIDVLELQAMVASAEGDHEATYRILSRAAAMKPTPELFQMLSATEADLDDTVRKQYAAFSDLRYAMEAWQADRIRPAEQALAQAAPVLSENETYLFYLGEMHRRSGRVDEATAAYHECLQQNPDHGRAIARMRQLNGD
jgi:tetratricopeptide (TPR) repeat protein